MNKIVIRPIHEKDLPFIEDVVVAAKEAQFKEERLSPEEVCEVRIRYQAERLSNEIKTNFYYVAEVPNENKIVGVAGLRKEEGSETYNRLSMFFILPEYQGKGIGRLLYEKVKQLALDKGCRKLVVSSSAIAEPVYAHLGFKKVRVDWKKIQRGPRSYNVYMEQEIC